MLEIFAISVEFLSYTVAEYSAKFTFCISCSILRMSWAEKEAELDRFYNIIQKTILDYQSAISGLVGDGRVGFVRDTVRINITS